MFFTEIIVIGIGAFYFEQI